LTTCKAGWCVDRTPLDLGATADLTARLGDFDGDGKVRSLERELRSLEGRTMTVTVVEPPEPATPGKGAESAAPADPASPVDPAAPTATPAETAAQAEPTDPPVAVTVDADGLVTSINGLTYVAPAATPAASS